MKNRLDPNMETATIEVFLGYLIGLGTNPVEHLEWWKLQFAMLMDGITDGEVGDKALNFLSWYPHEYLYQFDNSLCEYHEEPEPSGDQDYPHEVDGVVTMSQLG